MSAKPSVTAEQPEPEPPIDLARRLVRAEDRDLREVQREANDHRLRAEVVQAAHEPAAGDAVA